MRKVQFAEGECYHIYNRGVEKRDIFASVADYERFVYSLFACNNRQGVVNTARDYHGLATLARNLSRLLEPLVDILCFCLMPNHFHLLLQQRGERGVPLFMQKIGTAYTMYFNTKYERSGVLFQGPYHARHVGEDSYLLPASRYIHLNPLDLRQPAWRERRLHNPKAAHQFLLGYPWSTYGEYVGQPRYAGFVKTDLLGAIFGSADQYATYVTRDWRARSLRAVSDIAVDVPMFEAKPLCSKPLCSRLSLERSVIG